MAKKSNRAADSNPRAYIAASQRSPCSTCGSAQARRQLEEARRQLEEKLCDHGVGIRVQVHGGYDRYIIGK
jgi:hypothetical protein